MKTLSVYFSLLLIFILSTAQVIEAQLVCRSAPDPVIIQGSINAGDLQQAGRISRDGGASSCTGSTAVLENNDALRRDTHNLTNPFNEEVCVRVETDFAIWRPSEGNFYVRRSSDLTMQVFHWGLSGDIPQPADYDGDKKTDFAVWRPSTGVWYIFNSQTETFQAIKWGQQGDQPMAAAYRIQ